MFPAGIITAQQKLTRPRVKDGSAPRRKHEKQDGRGPLDNDRQFMFPGDSNNISERIDEASRERTFLIVSSSSP